jgi:hypothetical protein
MFGHSVVGRATVKFKGKKNSTTLGAEQSGVRITVGTINLSVLRNVHTDTDAHTASYSIGTAILYRGKSGRSVKLTIHLPQCQG